MMLAQTPPGDPGCLLPKWGEGEPQAQPRLPPSTWHPGGKTVPGDPGEEAVALWTDALSE